jgi:hypothetical protein
MYQYDTLPCPLRIQIFHIWRDAIGIPHVRNNAGGHGESPNTPSVPSYIASYALHITATNVLMVCEALKTMR